MRNDFILMNKCLPINASTGNNYLLLRDT